MMRRKNQKNPFAQIPGMRSMRCPYCGSPIELRSADGVYKTNKHHEMLYICSRYPACDAYVRIHPGTRKPMGTLANPALRRLRQQAHLSFDQLHQSGIMSKNQAYAWLADILHIPRSQAHIGYLDEYYCQVVIEESRKVLERFKKGGASA